LVQIAKSHEGDPSNQKSKNRQLAEAGSIELALEGDGDVFPIGNHTSHMKATHQTENQRTITSPKPALPN
jgi:hypothetical protein